MVIVFSYFYLKAIFINPSLSIRHSRAGGNPQAPPWIPACAGMTRFIAE
jgi:hypothetical protein